MPAPRQGHIYRNQQRKENNKVTPPCGLTVKKLNSNGWKVYHESSDLPAGGPYLRLKKHAIAMRNDLYATGVDFTQSVSAFKDNSIRHIIYPVLNKWHGKAAKGYDPVTGENYAPR